MTWPWICATVIVSVLTVAIDGNCLCRADGPVSRPKAEPEAQAAKHAPQPLGATLSIRVPRNSLAEAAIEQALAKPVELSYEKVPLGKVAEDLQAKLRIPVLLDKKGAR